MTLTANSDDAAEHGKGFAAGHIGSYYALTARKLTRFPVFSGRREAGICVIGGGLAGLSTALELAKAGEDVVLLEANRMGWSASGRNGGFVSAGYSESILRLEEKLGLDHARRLYALSVEGVGYMRHLIQQSGREDIIAGYGWLKMIRHGDSAELEIRAERMNRDYGAMIRFIPRAELSDFVTSGRYHAGLLDMGPFHIQPLDYAGLVADRAAAAGAALYENSWVKRVRRKKSGWRILTGDGEVLAREVVLATSAPNGSLSGPSRRLNAAILPVSTYVVTARSEKLDEAIHFGGCLGDTRRASDYYRIVGEGRDRRLLWGGRITTRRSLPPDIEARMTADIRSVYPQLDDLVIEQAWPGVMGYAIHKMPLIGRIGDRLWAATAFGGHGLNTTAMAGRLIARAIAHGEDEWRLFEPFSVQWAGGPFGRAATQLAYWRLQFLDRVEEWRASSGGRIRR